MGVTDVGASALASCVPRTLRRVAINLIGTKVSEERAQVHRHLASILSWEGGYGALAPPASVHNPFMGNSVTPEQRSRPSTAPDGGHGGPAGVAHAQVVVKESLDDFKLPSLGLRVCRGQGDALISIGEDKEAGRSLSRSQSDGGLRRSSKPPPKYKAKPFYKEEKAAYPRWIPAIADISPEGMYCKSPDPYRRLTGVKKVNWKL